MPSLSDGTEPMITLVTTGSKKAEPALARSSPAIRAQSATPEPIVLIQKSAAVARELPISRKGTGPYRSESRPATGARKVACRRERGYEYPHLRRRVPQRVEHEEGRDQQYPALGEVVVQQHQQAEGVLAAGEQLHLQDGARGAALRPDQRRQGQRGHHRAHDDRRRGEPQLAALVHYEQQRAHRPEQRRGSDGVDVWPLPDRAVVRQDPPGQQRAHEGDGHPGVEDGPPVQQVDQEAAGERPRRQPQPPPPRPRRPAPCPVPAPGSAP